MKFPYRTPTVLTLVLSLALSAAAQSAETFQNPVLSSDFPDPYILPVNGSYYAYATNAFGKNVQVSRSDDLVHWDLPKDAMPTLASWVRLGRPDVWAPEVMQVGGRYLLYYTARDEASGKQCLGVATSEAPEGKFRDENDHPFVCQTSEGGSIDAHPFRDEDGSLYLYWKNDGNAVGMATYIYVQELTPDGLGFLGEPVRLVRNDVAWEGGVVEAPTMWKREGRYYLFFSANSYAGLEYAVGYATCDTPTGPCEDAPENPILASRMEEPLVIGPGHQAIVKDKAGQTWLVYHAWQVTGGLRGNSRFMWLDRLEWREGKPAVEGPTAAPQEAPRTTP